MSTMSKVVLLGERPGWEDEGGLEEIFDLPVGLFDAPEPPAKPVLDSTSVIGPSSDRAFVERLKAAFTETQLQWYAPVRQVIFNTGSWRRGSYDRMGRAHAPHPMPNWITDNSAYRGQGRSFLLAVAYIDKALTYLGEKVALEDHFGVEGDDLVEGLVKDLIEVDGVVKSRASFGTRGILVIFSPEYLKSLIAP